MSKNDISFNLGSRRSLVASAAASVTLVPVFAADEGSQLKLAKRVSAQAKLNGFKGDSGQTLASSDASGGMVVNIGLGARDKFNLDAWKKAVASGVKQVRGLKTDSIALTMPADLVGPKALFGSASLFDIGAATAETAALVLYRANHYKTAEGGFKDEGSVKNVTVTAPGLNDAQKRELKRGLQAGAVIGSCVAQARDTANEPANICTPTFMAEQALQLAKDFPGSISVEILERKQCETLKMNAFMAVAKGSDEPPKFIIVKYTPAQCRADGPNLAIVGKSVTFDTGGVDLKPADGMRDMKYDMCGGADVLAAMRAIAYLGVPMKVTAYCAATENATGGSAYRPGDVYVGLDGRSYEIDNTDAEGRLTLVDAIAYARTFGKATHIVDYATLTGAILVALGDQVAGVFSNNQAFADRYLAAAKSQGEQAFQMPTWDVYKEYNKSTIADMKNSGGRFGGSITAALFVLSAARDVPAIHVDIAGTSFRNREIGVEPAGGTGWGVRTLIALAQDLAKNG
jgi:leucyl aminopeptidase